jgi:hypothetical protein
MINESVALKEQEYHDLERELEENERIIEAMNKDLYNMS